MKSESFSPSNSNLPSPTKKFLWDTFIFYTGQYARRVFLYFPIPIILIFLMLDYLPARHTHDFKTMLGEAIFIVFYCLTMAFLISTLVRFLIIFKGSAQLHRQLQSSWRFHAVLHSFCWATHIIFLEYLRPLLDPNALPFSKSFPSTFFALPLIALLLFFSLHSIYFKSSYHELQRMVAEAQYHALKTQMQPHFLFNSLNDLSELIEFDTGKARIMTQTLANFYREILGSCKSPTSPLGTEIAIIQKYLELIKIRFEDRLSFELKVPREAEKILVPSLMLQTLVENAIKHGIAKSMDAGFIRLEVWEEGPDFYHFRLINSGEPFNPKAPMGTGIPNSISRLTVLAGDRHNFRITPFEKGTMVDFLIPKVPG